MSLEALDDKKKTKTFMIEDSRMKKFCKFKKQNTELKGAYTINSKEIDLECH